MLKKHKADVFDGTDNFIAHQPAIRRGQSVRELSQLQRDKAHGSAGNVREKGLDDATSDLGAFTNVPHVPPTAIVGGSASSQHASLAKSTASHKPAHSSLEAFWDDLGDEISPAGSGVSTRSSAPIKRHKGSATSTKLHPNALEAFWDRLANEFDDSSIEADSSASTRSSAPVQRRKQGSATSTTSDPDALEAFWDSLGDESSDSNVRQVSPADSGISARSSASIKLRKPSATEATAQRPKGKRRARASQCRNNSGVASGSRITMEQSRASSMEIDEQDVNPPKLHDIQGWSDMLKQNYRTRKNLANIFGDSTPVSNNLNVSN